MSSPLTFRRIFRFWLPLAGTWLMMAVEGPLLAAIIARMSAAELNLAAYGVAYAFALVAEAPIIMLMSAATALVSGQRSYRQLRRFTAILCVLVTALMVLLLVPPVFDLIMFRLVGLSAEVGSRVYLALLVLLPWPGVIGLRRFYQGVLIRNRQTDRVALATVARVGFMALSALLLYCYPAVQGALLGGVALSCGVIAELVATRLLASGAVTRFLTTEDTEAGMDMRGLSRYYLPLAMTPFITLGVHPLVTFFLGQGRQPLESLAVMPVIGALVFVFRAIGLSFQEAGIALVGENTANWKTVGWFATTLAGVMTVLLVVIAYTPLAEFWFVRVSGLTQGLAEFSIWPLRLMAFLPAMTVMSAYLRALLMGAQVTRPISTATVVEAALIVAVLTALLYDASLPGAVCAAIAYLVGRMAAILWMLLPVRQVVRKNFAQ